MTGRFDQYALIVFRRISTNRFCESQLTSSPFHSSFELLIKNLSCFLLVVLEDRVQVFVMIKNPDGTFQKLGSVKANKVGTVRAIREDVKRVLPAKLQDKKFILLDETLNDIDGAKEKKLTFSEVYPSESVLLRWVVDKGMCGKF